jgi:translation initiation factor 1
VSRKKNRVVFSTETGDQRKQSAPPASPHTSLPPAQQNLKIIRDKKGRRGKVVTVVSGFVLTEADLKALAKTLKVLCGSGGTVKEGGIIEVQGDHRDKIAEKLRTLEYKVKLVGG